MWCMTYFICRNKSDTGQSDSQCQSDGGRRGVPEEKKPPSTPCKFRHLARGAS